MKTDLKAGPIAKKTLELVRIVVASSVGKTVAAAPGNAAPETEKGQQEEMPMEGAHCEYSKYNIEQRAEAFRTDKKP